MLACWPPPAHRACRRQWPPTRLEPRAFNIEAQDLGSALKAFAFQSNREIFFAPELTQGKLTYGVVGSYDDLDALKKILADTGLTLHRHRLQRDPGARLVECDFASVCLMRRAVPLFGWLAPK